MSDFINRLFPRLKGRPVVLYGTGMQSEALLKGRQDLDFHIAGVMDRVKTNGFFGGVPILNEDNVAEYSRDIIIQANALACHVIYERIRHLEARGLTIYFPNGECRSGRDGNGGDLGGAGKLFLKTSRDLKRLIDRHDIISFDLFDTLLMRMCLTEDALFELAEKRAGKPGFAENRKRGALDYTAESAKPAAMAGLYRYLAARRADLFSPETMNIEIESEFMVSLARPDMRACFEYAAASGKEVAIVTDMYLDSATLAGLLQKAGLNGYQHLIVSCEHGESKAEGGLWNTVKKLGPNILHIGDNPLADYQRPMEAGISACLIQSPAEIAEEMGLGRALVSAQNCYDCLALGLAVSRLLKIGADFAAAGPEADNSRETAKLPIKNAADLGFLFLGPQTHSFLCWLARQSLAAGEKTLYFFSRDGYLWEKLYAQLRGQWAEAAEAPPGRYFYTSRRALCGASAQTPEAIRLCVKLYLRSGILTVQEMLKAFFNVAVPADDFNQRVCDHYSCEELSDYIITQHGPAVMERSALERDHYSRYIGQTIDDGEKIAFVDFVAGNRCAALLQGLLGREFTVYLYGRSLDSENARGAFDETRLRPYLDRTFAGVFRAYEVIEFQSFAEVIYTSPDTALEYFNENGEPVFAAGARDFSFLREIHRGIEEYCALMTSFQGEPCAAKTADLIFGALFSGRYRVAEEILETLVSSDSLRKDILRFSDCQIFKL